MISSFPLWWLALASLAVPILLHRARRERIKAKTLATARFVAAANPEQLRVWQWEDILLLVARCLLLAGVVAWLADPILPWRGDTVLVVKGSDPAWVEAQVQDARMASATRIESERDVLAWLAAHEAEWRGGARLLVLGDAAMPAHRPSLRHALELRTRAAAERQEPTRVHLASNRPEAWQPFFAAATANGMKLAFSKSPGVDTGLIIWDQEGTPPPAWRAPLWWTIDAKQTTAMRITDAANGRTWTLAGPPASVEAARDLYLAWQTLHAAPVAYAAPAQTLAAGGEAAAPAGGALRDALAIVLTILFALERLLTHVRRP